MRWYFAQSAAGGLILLAILVAQQAALAQTWDGGGANNNWTNGLNWGGDVAPVNNGTAAIIMAGIVDPTPVVDVAQSINSLTFNNTAGAFTISGSALTIGNGGFTNSDADTQTINSNITLGATQTWNANSGNLVVAGNISPSGAVDLIVRGASNTTLSGVVSGTIGFNKFNGGTGTLTLSGTGANTYTRDTAVNAGTLLLNKTAGVNAIANGTVTVGDGIGAVNDDVLRLNASNQIANTVNMVLTSTGHFDLNGFNETINGTLTIIGGNITTGLGTLTLGNNITVNSPGGFAATSTISGNLSLTTQRTLTVSDGLAAIDLDIPATITTGGIIKTGAGTMRLGASNTLPSNVRIDTGTVLIGNSGAFGTGNVQFNGGAIGTDVFGLPVLANNFTIAGNVGVVSDFSISISGNVTLSGGDRTITTTTDLLGGVGFSGVIGEDVAGRSLTIDGNGGVSFHGSSANTYTGTTTVNGGFLSLAKSAANGAIIGNFVIGDGIGSDFVSAPASEQINNSSTVTINSSGTLQLSEGLGAAETIASLVLNGGEVDGRTTTLTVTAGISSNAHANTATIRSNPNGALSLGGGNVPFTVADGAAAIDLDVSAQVQNGSLTKNGLGTMRFSGSFSNTYNGTTTVNEGTLVLSKTSGNALSGQLVIGDGSGGPASDVVRLDASGQLGPNVGVAVVVNESGLLNLNNRDQSLLGSITLTGGAVTTGMGTLRVGGLVTTNASAQTASISGNLDSSAVGGDTDFDVADGAAPIDLNVSAAVSTIGGIVKNGAGTLKFSGTNTYAGDTLLNLGVLEVAADANLGAATSGLTFDGGTLRTTASFPISRTIVLQSGGGTIETLGLTTLTGPISGTGALTKSGLGTLVLNSASLSLSALTISAGDLQVPAGGSLDVTGTTTVGTAGFFAVDGGLITAASFVNSGEIELLNNARLVGPVVNSGVLGGHGRISGPLTNALSGQVRVGMNESIHFDIVSASSNAGLIEVIEGEIEFDGALTNAASTGLIAARDAALRFNAGLTNSGSVALSFGVSDVFGDITNQPGASIVVSGGAEVTFYDDISQNGTFRVRQIGSSTSVAVVLGAFTGSGGTTGGGDIFFEGDLRPGNSAATVTFGNNIALGAGTSLEIEVGGTLPGTQYDQVHVAGQLLLDGTLAVSLLDGFVPLVGNSFDILDWATLTGTFDVLQLPTLSGGLTWDTDELYTTGILTVASAGLVGDYNANGVVDGADYVIWRKTLGSATNLAADGNGNGSVDPGDFDVWRAHFGQTGGSGAGASANTAVPEPATALLMLIMGIISICTWRRAAVPSTHMCMRHIENRPVFGTVWRLVVQPPFNNRQLWGQCCVRPVTESDLCRLAPNWLMLS